MKRILYRLKKVFQRGIFSQLVLLAGCIALAVFVVSWLMSLCFGVAFGPMVWKNLMHLIDQGTITGEEGTIAYLLLLTIVTLLGIFIWSTVVAILNEGLRGWLDRLRNGVGQIEERGHVVILGWDESISFLLKEYASFGIKKVIILTEEEREVPEEKQLKKIELIVKRGNPCDINLLEKLNLQYCKAIVVLPKTDAIALKQLLAIRQVFKKLRVLNKINLSVLIQDDHYKDVFSTIDIKNCNILSINKEDILTKVTVQSLVFCGLFSIYRELFSYDGNEFYIERNPFPGESVKEIAKKCFECGSLLVGYLEEENSSFCTTLDPEILLSEKSSLILISQEKPNFNQKNKPKDKYPIFDEGVHQNQHQPKASTKNILSIGKRGLLCSIVESSYGEYVNKIEFLQADDLLAVEDKCEFLKKKIVENEISHILLNSIAEKDDTDFMAIYFLIKHLAKTDATVANLISSLLLRINDNANTQLLLDEDSENLIISGHLVASLLGQATLKPLIFNLIDELLNSDKNEFAIIPAAKDDIGKEFEFLYFKYLTDCPTPKTLIGIRRNGKAYLNPPPDSKIELADHLICIGDFVDGFRGGLRI